MNSIFLENLKKYTKVPYELIIIDNASSDGSRELFERFGARMIYNNGNYSYPYCQNQGIEIAQYDILAFLNNDIILSPNWDERLLKVMTEKKLDIVTMSTNDRIESRSATKKIYKRWKYIKYPIQFLFGNTVFGLKLMHKLMYGNWKKWTTKRWNTFQADVQEGFSGSCIMMNKSALDKIGLWDERIQAADFDTYMRSKKRYIEYKDILPIHNLLGVYIHHYGKLTLKSKNLTPFTDKDNLIPLKEKWGDEHDKMLKDLP
jgi:GT2 family glycosyltransferase